MARGRGVTLKGEAARAFIEERWQLGEPKAVTPKDKYLVIATKVSMLMRTGSKPNADIATSLLALLEEQGLDGAYELARRA